VPARSGTVADAAARAVSSESYFAGDPHPPTAWPAKRAGQAVGPSLSRKRERAAGQDSGARSHLVIKTQR